MRYPAGSGNKLPTAPQQPSSLGPLRKTQHTRRCPQRDHRTLLRELQMQFARYATFKCSALACPLGLTSLRCDRGHDSWVFGGYDAHRTKRVFTRPPGQLCPAFQLFDLEVYEAAKLVGYAIQDIWQRYRMHRVPSDTASQSIERAT